MGKSTKQIAVIGAFDNLRSHHLRFLQEASMLGNLTLFLPADDVIRAATGKPPRFPLPERLYLLQAVRFVSRVLPVLTPLQPDRLPVVDGFRPDVWVDEDSPAGAARGAFCRDQGCEYRVLDARQLQGFPEVALAAPAPGRKKVVVTGCYDWFHSGHVRFFEEVSAYGELYVILGHDANIRLLKGEGHPLLPEAERRYLVGSVKFVHQALLSSGDGWLDADPEIQRLKPDIYAVNEDGDKGGKREYCAKNGIEYLVLKRVPALGLPRRTSTDLRGF